MALPELARPRSIAGVVIFHPERENLLRSIAQVAPEVAAVVVYANSAIEGDLEQDLRANAGETPLVVVSPGENLGLGTAYNAIVAMAPQFDATHVLLLDQDSTPPPGMVRKLEAIHRELYRSGKRPAAIGPQPVGPNGRPLKVPRRGTRDGGVTQSDFIISSGSLVSLEAAHAVGGFREDFFIDAIDLEWCFRARHLGWSIWVADDVPLAHQLGRGVISLPFGLRLANQPPTRFYTYLRNQLAMLRLPHVPARRKALTLAYLPFQSAVYGIRHRFSRPIIRAISAGFVHGLANRLGAPHKCWIWIDGNHGKSS